MKLVALFAASLLGVSAFAQTAAVETGGVSAGLLGTRYADAGFGWINYRHTSLDSFGTGVDVNVPVRRNIDVALNYSYAWLEGAEELGHYVGTSVIGYCARGDSKPFARLGVGYSWTATRFDSDYGVWDGEVGIERTVNDKVSSTFSVGYQDDFGQHRDSLWTASLGATYAFTSKLVGLAKISYIEFGHSSYFLGLAYRF